MFSTVLLVDRLHLQEKCSIKTGFLPNYETRKIIYLTKLQYNFWVGGRKWVGMWRTNKQNFIFSLFQVCCGMIPIHATIGYTMQKMIFVEKIE